MGNPRIFRGAAIALIALTTFLVVNGFLLAAAAADLNPDLGDSEREALHGTITLLKWAMIGGMGAMAAVIGILWRANSEKDKTIRDVYKESAEKLTAAVVRNSTVLEEVGQEIQFCRRKNENTTAKEAGKLEPH